MKKISQEKISQELKIKLLPWLAALGLFMQMLDGSILNTALPSIAANIGENPLQMQAVVVAYLLSVAIFLPVSGWAGERFGIKRAFLFAIAIFTAGSAFCAAADSLKTLAAARVLQGIGGAFLVPTARLAVLRVYPRKQYASVLSFMVLPALLGPLLGPAVGGFLVQYASWHWIFLINIPVGIICFAATLCIMPKIASYYRGEAFDFKGFIIFDIAVLLLSAAGASGRIVPQVSNGYFILLAFVFIGAYFFYAKNRTNALFSLDMFKIKSFAVGIAGNIFIRIVGGALPFLAPLFFQTALGFSPSKAGMTLIPMGIASMFAKTFAARLILKAGYRRFLILNTIFLSVFIAVAGFITGSTPYWLIIIIYFLLGAANSLQFTAINTLALIDMPDKFMSGANNLLSVSFQISISMGVALSAFLLSKAGALQFIAHRQNSLPAVFTVTYIIVSGISVLGVFLFLYIPKNAGNGAAGLHCVDI
jgi:EmrB/QacA subfamily drug resistance transporter